MQLSIELDKNQTLSLPGVEALPNRSPSQGADARPLHVPQAGKGIL